MRIIVSPAKKMRADTESFAVRELPHYLSDAEQISGVLQSMSDMELKKLWKCNDSIAELNIRRLHTLDLRNYLTPAILAYEGIQYQYMAPSVFTQEALEYIQEHLRILSGLYGILRPFDGVTPYRLEMQSKLKINNSADLYSYWGDRLANYLCSESDCIVNLASKEYSICISRYLPDNVRFITCVFGEEINGKVLEKGTLCKMARGEMVRFLAENQIQKVEELRHFSGLNYRFDEVRSDEKTYVFVLQKEIGND